jgi:uncharacterized protein
MRKNIAKRIILSLVACFILLSPALLPADMALAKTTTDIQHIYDDAGLLSSSELDTLEDKCEEYSKKDDIDIIILTHNNSDTVNGEIYIENFNDQKRYLDSVILLVDMSRRDVIVQGYGIAQNKVTSPIATKIAEDVSPYLTDENYAGAFEEYIRLSDKYMNYVPFYLNSLFHIAVALLIGGITVSTMAFNAGGKMTVNGNNYIDVGNSGLIGRRDDYIRTQVTRIRKPQNNGGGGGGGISAGGLSHSSGSAKF